MLWPGLQTTYPYFYFDERLVHKRHGLCVVQCLCRHALPVIEGNANFVCSAGYPRQVNLGT